MCSLEDLAGLSVGREGGEACHLEETLYVHEEVVQVLVRGQDGRVELEGD